MRGFPCSLTSLCPWGWLWNQLPQNRIPLSVLIYHVQPFVPLTWQNLSPDFQKALNFTGQMQCKLIFLLITFLSPYLFSGEAHSRTWGRGEAEGNTVLVHRQSPHTQILKLKPQDLIWAQTGHMCQESWVWAPQNAQGKMFSHWCGTACAWMLQNVPQVTASACRVSDTCKCLICTDSWCDPIY